MKILVTGAAGFIGSHLVDRLLADGHHVVGLDNLSVGNFTNLEGALRKNNFEFIEGDIRDNKSLECLDVDFDAIAHLAALADIVPSIEKPKDYFETNVVGTFNVVQFSLKCRVKKFIYIASSSCYGIPDNFPTAENAKIDPRYPYALTKFLGESIVMHWSQVYKIPSISLRLFNVYGPRARTSGTYGAVFGVFLAQKIAGKPLTVVGDGTQTRDFTYVSDVINAISLSLNSDKVGIFNVGSGRTYSINYLVELLKCDFVYIPKRPGEPNCTYADNRKIGVEIGWKPMVSLEEGVGIMLSSLSLWKDAPVWEPDSISIVTSEWFKYLGE